MMSDTLCEMLRFAPLRDGFGDDLATALSYFTSGAGRRIGNLRILGVFLHGCRDFFHRRGSLFEASSLLLSALRKVCGAGRNLRRSASYLARDLHDRGDGFLQSRQGSVEIVLDLSIDRRELIIEPIGQIAA